MAVPGLVADPKAQVDADDLRTAQTRASEIADTPGRYYLSTGETIVHGPEATSRHSRWWITDANKPLPHPPGNASTAQEPTPPPRSTRPTSRSWAPAGRAASEA